MSEKIIGMIDDIEPVTVEYIEVPAPETNVITMESAFPPVGEPNEALNHAVLNNRDADDQHPIGAITGLQRELDLINALQTVDSDKIGVANYYEWSDASYNDYGYFVSLVPKTTTIKICDGSEILGVTVSEAGFVGGQGGITLDYVNGVSTVPILPRDNKYGLVATSGLVDVRCELEVEVGDYVISNSVGYAEKTESKSGYKVLARENKKGVEYAVILLGVQADVTDALDKALQVVDERMDNAEINIASAMSLANDAYMMAEEIGESNNNTCDQVADALNKVDGVVSDVNDMKTQMGNMLITSAQAKAIAEGAVVSAESARNEAVEKANEAITEAASLRNEVEAKVSEIDIELERYYLEIETTREELGAAINEISEDVDAAVKDVNDAKTELDKAKEDLSRATSSFEELKEDLVPLTSWPDSENPTGIAGFVARANEDSAMLGSIVEWKGETNESMAAFKQEVSDKYATIESVTKLETDTSNAIVGVKQEASEKYATIESVTTLRTDTSDAIANTKQEVEKTYATIESVTAFENETNESLSKVSEKADANESSISGLASWKDSASEAISKVEQKSNENESKISSLTSWQNEAKTSISNVEQKSNEHESKINSLTSWQSEASEAIANVEQKAADNESSISTMTTWKDETSKSIAAVEQKANTNESSIKSLATWKDEASKSIASVEQKANANEASITSLTKWQGDVNTSIAGIEQTVGGHESSINTLTSWKSDASTSIANVEQKANNNESKINSLTSWQGETNTAMASIKQKADANGASIQLLAADVNKYSVGPYSQAYGFTLEQAREVLVEGMVYVPTPHIDTGTHSEVYKYTEVGADGNDAIKSYPDNDGYQFTPGYIYTWKDIDDAADTTTMMWSESVGEVVTFRSAPSGTAFDFWYKNGGDNSDGYETDTLYKLDVYTDEDNNTLTRWIAVATLQGNFNNRSVSQIRQDANSIELEVSNIKGDVASSKLWIDNNSSNIQNVVTWKSDVENDVSSIATIKQTAENNRADIALVVTDGGINAASIVTAVNNAGSSVVIDADHIQLDGVVSLVNNKTDEIKNNAVYDTKVEYALSSSGTEFIAVTEWSAVAPAWQDGAYMWQKTTITKGDNSVASTTTCIQGAKGQDGEDGKTPVKGVDYFDGSNGEDGTSIIWKGTYASEPSNADNGWAYYNSTAKASYTYRDGSWYQMSIDGVDGVGINATTIAYGVSNSASSKPTSWGADIPDVSEGSYLWTRTIVDYTDSSKEDTVTYTYSRQGADGSTPVKGVDYVDGTSVTVKSIQYQAGTSATTAPTGTWNNSVVSVGQGQYLWSKTTFSDDTVAYGISRQGKDGQDGISIAWKGESASAPTSPQKNWVYKDSDDGKVYIYNGTGWELMVLDGSDGQDGTNGSDGLSVFITYNDSSVTPSTPTGNGATNGWHTNATSTSIWMSQKVAKDSASGTWGAPIKIKGEDGKNGVGVSSTTVTYGVSDSASVKPTSWQSSIPVVGENEYLWTRTVIDYTDSSVADTVTYTYTKQGAKGETGSAGTSVSVSSIKYQAGTSATTTPTGTWSDTVVSVSEGQYLWTKTTFSDGKTAYGVAKQGTSGKDGSGVKKINTHVRNFSMQYWRKYGEVGHEENWTTGADYDNTHINVGDTAYLVGTISDVIGAGGAPAEAVIYGTVIQNVANHVRMVSSYLITGGKNGEQGIQGDKGADAPKVTNVTKQYYLSSSNTSLAGGSWSTVPAGFTKGSYMWTRDVYTMSDNSTINGDPTLDNTFTTISSWCSANDTTLIDGAHIATGTIDADQIAANAITADKIKAGEISAQHIASKSITADQIDATNLKVNATNVTGVLTIGQLPETVAETDDIPTKTSDLDNDSGFQNASGVTTIIDGKVTTDYIEALNISVKAAQISDVLTIGQLPTTIAEKDDIPTDDEITTITNNTISTTNVVAANLTVKAANIDGKLTADKIATGAITIGAFDDEVAAKLQNSVASTKIEYALSDGSTNNDAPESGWSTTAPEWQADMYMWQKTTITYTDTTKEPTITITCIQGAKGEDGYTPVKGKDYFDGTNGENGTSIVWKGSFDNPPADPQNGWAYYDKTQHASYTYQNGWYQMSVDGVNGQNGNDGSSIVWKGESSTRPANGEKNWVYKNTNDGIVYICVGNDLWEPMVLDGSDGEDGTNGTDGLSVFITYHNSITTPDVPTGNGTLNGWHTDATSNVVWMSQKVAKSATDGEWGYPIKIKGETGGDGISVDKVTTRYYISTSNKNKPSDDANDANGWFEDFDEMLDRYWELKDTDSTIVYYVWSQEKVDYSNDTYTCSEPTVNGATSVISMYCKDNGQTKINGANIATGTITADHINTRGLSAEKIEVKDDSGKTIFDADVSTKSVKMSAACIDGKLTADKINADGIEVSLGKIGSWDITTDGITKNTVGLMSGYTYSGESLVTPGTQSPVRFYAGIRTLTFYGSTITPYSVSPIANNMMNVLYAYDPSTDRAGVGEFTVKSVLFMNPAIASIVESQSIEYVDGKAYIRIQVTRVNYASYVDWGLYCYIEYVEGFNTQILEDGSLYAMDADIEGNIRATSGTFSNCTIDDTCVINGTLGADIICSREETTGRSASIEYIGYKDVANNTYIAGYDIRTYGAGLSSVGTSCDRWGDVVASMSANKASSGDSSVSVRPTNIELYSNIYDTNGSRYGGISISGDSGILRGSWTGTVSQGTSSDANAKNSIADMDDRYCVLFDNLHPRIYKYNDGTSDRLHTGFVAQEVDEALTVAGLDRTEFAALCISDIGTEDEQWSLRYDEFIALCVGEIQKLKARVNELETVIKQMKTDE